MQTPGKHLLRPYRTFGIQGHDGYNRRIRYATRAGQGVVPDGQNDFRFMFFYYFNKLSLILFRKNNPVRLRSPGRLEPLDRIVIGFDSDTLNRQRPRLGHGHPSEKQQQRDENREDIFQHGGYKLLPQ